MSDAETYDYVIVGAGSAGCVLANRLTASGQHRVLLIEAGPRDTNPWIHVPLGYGKHFTNPKVNWLYQTADEPHCDNRNIIQPRGKVLGGSSSINGLLYVRGQHADYDHWRQLGNVGWSFDDILPYFRKAEDQTRADLDDEWHGTGGPLAVSDLPERHPLCDAYLDAAEACGYKRNADFNGADQEGYGYYQLTARNGRRCSAAVGYLNPAKSRPNLSIVSDALVTRINVENRRATGVTYEQAGLRHTVKARAEVVLSAGAFNSPQILQLSGIGPADLLKRHGIDVVADVPGVGANYQDHYAARMVYKVNQPFTINDTVNSWTKSVAAGLQYALQRRGVLTLGACQVGGFVKTRPDVATPDAQMHIMLFSTDKLGTVLHPFSGVTAPIIILRPESRGTVTIGSSDPRDAPVILGNYLASERDCDVMVEAAKIQRKILAHPTVARYIVAEHDPGPDCRTDDELLAFIRCTGATVYHPVSTCRMGVDPGAVVDPRLRFNGIAGLRVVDASIMPALVSGNTNAPTIMVAEKGADMILADAKSGQGAAAA